MGRTRMGRTDGLTDGRTRRRLYAPPKFFGEHKNQAYVSQKQRRFQKCKISQNDLK